MDLNNSSDESFGQDAGHGEIDFKKDVDLNNSSDDGKSSDEEKSILEMESLPTHPGYIELLFNCAISR